MILLDANLLLYAYNQSAPQHERARRFIEAAFSGAEPVGIPWITLLAFVRIATNARAFSAPLSIDEAVATVDEWLEQPPVAVIAPGDGHWTTLRAQLVGGQASGPLVTDAHLAALAIEQGATLYTTDRDFARFPRLRWSNPLDPPSK